MRVLAWVAVVLVVLIVAGAAAVYFIIERGYLTGLAAGAASGALGREVTIGRVGVDFGRTTVVSLHDVTVANPDWAEAEHAARVDTIDIAVKAWPLLRLDLQMPYVEVHGGEINAEVSADGDNNWSSAEPAGKVAAPEERTEFPAIDRLTVTETKVSYVDRKRGLNLKGTGAAAIPGEEPRIHIALEGTLNEDPLQIEFVGGPPSALRNPEQPYPVDLAIRQAETTATIKGTVAEPLDFHDFSIDMTLAGPSLSEILPALDLPLPITAQYELAGQLSRAGDVWRFQKFNGAVGESDLAGDLMVDVSAEKPRIEGDLVSRQLHFRDLAGLVGLDPETIEPVEGGDGLLPDVPLNVERLHSADLNIRLKAEKVVTPNLPFDSLDGTFNLTDARLQVRPLKLGTARGGEVEGTIVINAREATPSAAADMVLRDIDLRSFFEDSELVQQMGGSFSGRIDLTGTGSSVADMLSVADGYARLSMRDGRISGLVVEAIGADVAEALLLAVTGDVSVPIRCGRADTTVKDGVAEIEQIVLDTTDSTLVAAGQANLAKETLDVQIEARAKDFSILDLGTPVRVHGAWQEPEVALKGLDPLPFFEMGEQENIDCARLLEGVMQAPADTR